MPTTTLTETAQALFAAYPQAVENDSMVLLVADGDDARFCILSSWHGELSSPFFDVTQWRGAAVARLDDETIPDWAIDAVTRGVPLPRDGSLYGWVDRGRVTAMIAFYAHYTLDVPEPRWSPMPDADASEAVWPPFTGERLLGPWLWEYFQAGRVVDLAPLVADSPGAVFWVDTIETLGSGPVVVTHDLASPAGWTLPRGRYVYYQHRDGAPSLDELLADPGKTDLAPRFREF